MSITSQVPNEGDMLIFRIMLSGAIGLLVAVLWWALPEKPQWRIDRGRTELLGLGIGDHLLTYHPRETEPPHVCSWEAASGRLVTQVELEKVEQKFGIATAQLLNDRESLLVGECVEMEAGWRGYGKYILYDGRTGKRKLVLPLSPEGGHVECSRNGRLAALAFWVQRKNARDRVDSDRMIGVLDIQADKPIFRIAPRAGFEPFSLAFAPDSRSAAVLWGSGAAPEKGEKRRLALSVAEIPSGKEMARVELPGDRHWSVQKLEWTGREVYMTALTPWGPDNDLIPNVSVRFELKGQSLTGGELDPSRSWEAPPVPRGLMKSYPIENGVVHVETRRPNERAFVEDWGSWLWAKLGLAPDHPPQKAEATVVHLGKIRSRAVCYISDEVVVTRDGRYLATKTRRGDVVLWDLAAAPSIRWPGVLLAGVLAFGISLVLTRFVRMRKKVSVTA